MATKPKKVEAKQEEVKEEKKVEKKVNIKEAVLVLIEDNMKYCDLIGTQQPHKKLQYLNTKEMFIKLYTQVKEM